jgi:hypothetical protein
MWLWGYTPYDTAPELAALRQFIADQNVSTIFFDMYEPVGPSSTAQSRADARTIISDVHARGGKVYAVAGAATWAGDGYDAWTQTNIIGNVVSFNNAGTPSQRFDGFCYDVEYWTTGIARDAALAGMQDLYDGSKADLGGLEVGFFASFFLTDPDRTVLYNGTTKPDGQHLVDMADFLVVACFQRHANPFSDQSGQIAHFAAFAEYAASTNGAELYCASETNDVGADLSFFGATKADLETEHALTVNAYKNNPKFRGMSVEDYEGWAALT